MAARSGMSNLITRLRRLVADAGTAQWDEDALQQLLDTNRVELVQWPLDPDARQIGVNSVVYTLYRVPGDVADFEEATSGTTAWRVFDSAGTDIGTADYSVDYQRGLVTFSADQVGSARYLDARAYDLNAAAALAWRERAADTSDKYTFQADGASFNRSDWFDHCVKMAEGFEAKTRPVISTVVT